MKLYRTPHGAVLEQAGAYYDVSTDWDTLLNHHDLVAYLRHASSRSSGRSELGDRVLAPIGTQEVWAAGVTYYRSRAARIEESRDAGGATFYDKVYEAERPELFFKAPAWRVRASGEPVRVRRDARWTVPEPEIALCINARGTIVGYTIGNDMSSRDIEGENPLYLPQAKIYDGACAMGPAMLVSTDPLPPDTAIELRVTRGGTAVVGGRTTFSQMRRNPGELVEFLYRETTFPTGCVLLTGTGIVPPDDFTLQSGDEIRIDVPSIGTLTNPVGAT
ncbi:MAG TPA: fumarylacetoacetate hydrolase family protein [Gemmatimonadaceae bacterium]|nr:fumarylacetoacetate hydrolase family protein [Gemmatimonadaceae bacterium]